MAGGDDARGVWDIATEKRPGRMAHLVEDWPDGRGSWMLVACAPVGAWSEAEEALAAASVGLEATPRSGLAAAVARALDLADAARSWRFILKGMALEARVAGARQVALHALRAAPGFQDHSEALMAAAVVLALDRRGVEAGPGWDAGQVLAVISSAVALDPSGKAPPGAAPLEGKARLALGQPARALEILEPLAARLPRPQADLLLDLGEALEAVGRVADAGEVYRRAQATLDQDRRHALAGTGPLAADVRRRLEELEVRLAARLRR